MKYSSLFFLLFSVTFIPLFAQKNKVDPVDFSFAESMKSEYEDASVIATTSKTEVTFDFDKGTNQVLVNVTKEETLVSLKPGYRHNVVEFFNENSRITRAEAFNYKGKRIPISRQEETYSSNDIFYSDAQVSYFPLSFPSIGTRIRVKSSKQYTDIRYFVAEYLSDVYPVKSKSLRYRIPTWLQADFKKMNFSDVIEKESTDEKTGDRIYTFTRENVPPQAQESSAKGPSHLYPHLLFLYQGYEYEGKKYAGFKETKDLYTWYRSLIKGMNNQPEEVATLAKELTANATNDTDKIKAIYYWVQENIRYIAFEDGIAGFRPDNCQAVYQKKYGDCKGMANLTKEMLVSVGLDARLVWIGTRRLAYDYSTPSLGVDNHMICAVKQNDDFIFLDATEEFNELDTYAERIQGRQVMIEDGDMFIAKTIPVQDYKDNTNKTQQILKIEDEKLTGTATLELEGESKAYFLYRVNNMKQSNIDEALIAYLNNSDKSCKVSDIKTTDLTNRDGNIKIDYNFSWSKGVSAFGDEIYVDLDFEKEFKDWTFEDRQTDYLFGAKKHQVSEIILEVPAGYTVGSLPTKFERVHEDFFFKIEYVSQNGKIIYRKEIGIPNSEIKAKDFEKWNEFTKALRKQYKEQIVLKKG